MVVVDSPEQNLAEHLLEHRIDRVIALLDLDCFYCQVEQKRCGISRDVPLAVRQWNSLIAVNYAARKQGIPSRTFNGTIEEVQKMCPGIVLVHCDTIDENCRRRSYAPDQVPESFGDRKICLQRYREESCKIVQLLQDFSPDVVVEKASIDESYLDLTNLVRRKMNSNTDRSSESATGFVEGLSEDEKFVPNTSSDVLLTLASGIVAEIRECLFRELDYTASAGIAHCKTLAKLASSRHKPNNQTIVPDGSTALLLSDVGISQVKNLGGKLGKRLLDLGVSTPNQVVTEFSLNRLQNLFSLQTANYIWRLCHGVDEEEVVPKSLPSSLLASKNFSKPLMEKLDVDKWLRLLCFEIKMRIEFDFKMYKRLPTSLHIFAQNGSRTCPISSSTGRPPSLDVLLPAAMSLFSKFPSPIPCHRLSIGVMSFKSCINSIEKFLVKTKTECSMVEVDSVATESTEKSDFVCGLCGKTIRAEDAAEHSNYHVALRLQQYEQKLVQREKRPKPSSANKRRKDTKLKTTQRYLSSFFRKKATQ